MITKENLEYISINSETGVMVIAWDTRGEEDAINKIELKVEVLKTHRSTYKAPNIKWDQNYSEAF